MLLDDLWQATFAEPTKGQEEKVQPISAGGISDVYGDATSKILEGASTIPLEAYNQSIDTALKYGLSGLSINMGQGAGNAINVSPGWIIGEGLADPNRAVSNTMAFFRDVIYKGKRHQQNVLTVYQSTGDALNRLNMSLAFRNTAISDTRRQEILDLWKSEDYWVSHTASKYAVEGIKEDLMSSGFSTDIADMFGDLTNSHNREVVRQRVIGFDSKGKALDWLTDEASRRRITFNLSTFNKNQRKQLASAVLSLTRGDLYESQYLGKAVDVRSLAWKKLADAMQSSGNPNEAQLAQYIHKIGTGKVNKSTAAFFKKWYYDPKKIWDDLQSNGVKGSLTGSLFAKYGFKKYMDKDRPWLGDFQFEGLWKGSIINRISATIFLFHPAAAIRGILWDGDWVNAWLSVLGKKQLPYIGVKGMYNYLYTKAKMRLMQRLPWLDAVYVAEHILKNPALAEMIKDVKAMGLPDVARRRIRAYFKKLAQKVTKKLLDIAAKYAAKAGVQTVVHGLLQGLATASDIVIPIIGHVIAYVVGVILEKVVWGLVELMLHVVMIIAILFIFMCFTAQGMLQSVQLLYPVHFIPGETMEDLAYEDANFSMGGWGGPMVTDPTLQLVSYSIAYPLHGNVRCTQGYNGKTSHASLYAKGFRPLDLSPTTGDYMVYSPVSGKVVSIGSQGPALGFITVQADNGDQYHMVHIDQSTCRVSVGSRVTQGDPLCRLYTFKPSDGGGCPPKYGSQCVMCPSGKAVCWTGAHLHIYGVSAEGRPLDIKTAWNILSCLEE